MFLDFYNFIKDIVKDKRLILEMAKNDFRMKNSGSVLGILWLFFQPLMTILVMWIVFELGFRSSPIDNTPFILWFVPAYIPWIFFSDMLSSTSNCLYEYSFLVKKVKFRVSLLPIVKIISAMFVHIFFIIFIVLVYLLYGRYPNIYFFQSLYYSISLIIFTIGLSWVISAISVFLKDIGQIVTIFLQIGFWATPIFWNPENMIPSISKILKLNPIYYIIRGYRDSFIDMIPFWERKGTSLYFWVFSIILFVFGAYTFKKFRPYFADEL